MALQEEFELQGNFLFKHRGVLPIFILLFGLVAFIVHEEHMLQGGYNEINGLYPYFCLFVSLFGFGIRVYTVGYSHDNTSGRNTMTQIAQVVNNTGLYSIVRHPLYLGNFFMWLGLALLSENVWFLLAFILMYWIYYERIMFAEEQFLRKKFGDTYLTWAKQVPAFLPNFKNFKKPDTKFNAMKVIKQEKTGFFLLFMFYFLFYEIGLSISLNKPAIQFNFWFYAMAISLLTYLLLKVFAKNLSTPM